MKKFLLFGGIFTMIFFSSCEPEVVVDPPAFTGVKVVFDLRYEGQPFVMSDVYWDSFDHRIRIDNIMSYFSMLKLVKEDGSKVLLKDFYLANFSESANLTFELPAGHYNGLEFGLGVPHDYNKDIDPTIYPNDHPLSVPGSEGMFWAWNTGYIFVKFEGKADTLGVEGNPLLHPFAFHVGDDPMYRFVNMEGLDVHVETGKTKIIRIVIAVDKILYSENDEIDLATDYLTHTSDNTELASKFMNNYKNAITVE